MFLVYYFQLTFFKYHRSLIRLKMGLHVFFFTSGRSYQLLILFVLFYILILHREVLHEIVPSTLQVIKIKNNLNRRRNKYPTLTYKEDWSQGKKVKEKNSRKDADDRRSSHCRPTSTTAEHKYHNLYKNLLWIYREITIIQEMITFTNRFQFRNFPQDGSGNEILPSSWQGNIRSPRKLNVIVTCTLASANPIKIV